HTLARFVSHHRGAVQAQSRKFPGKIQSIYNRKCAPITMQGFAQASENPPAQEQWRTMKKTMRRAIGTVGESGQVLTVRLDAGRRDAGAAGEAGENKKPRR